VLLVFGLLAAGLGRAASCDRSQVHVDAIKLRSRLWVGRHWQHSGSGAASPPPLPPCRHRLTRGPLSPAQVLITRGFPFCDEDEPEQPQFPPPLLEGQAQGGAAAAVEPLLLVGVEASSADSPQQGIRARIACQ
jgi:hypothetical protein